MLPDRLNRLIDLLARLPGVGEKTAARFALYFATESQEYARELGLSLAELGESVRRCERCNNIAEVDESGRARCPVCRDKRRDGTLLCIVARVQDLLAIEKSAAMRGRYFVLGRLLSPLDGIGPDELPLGDLFRMIEEDGVKEVILATPPSVDGEATALLLARELGGRGLNVSRIASGVPHGGDLEFADQITLGRAIDGRRAMRS
ncbi:MAG TPA: recombination mediator RecR [Polyangiaceae bacterium]|jgi:recombination protein RecR|nr:recombination mediator RecR [Polyangiaceae bacterium]